MADFAETLQRFMDGKIGSQKLSNLTKISKTKIDSWLQGRVRRPRDWRHILTIAQALLLTRAETDTLLLSAHQPTLSELAEQIALEHPDRRYLRPWLGAAPITLSARHQLRAPVGDFVGRTAEIVTLVDALCSAGSGGVAGITGVQGMGGIGKTELAYVVAQKVRHAFPDGQIVLTLRGSGATPLPPEHALQAVIRAFTPDATLPDDLPALEVLYRTQLDTRRVLILADDAANAAQVEPLLPPAGCALLITSRLRFTLPAMTTVDLDQLPPVAASQLLRVLHPQLTADETARLARACGYLPLALRVSGSLLRTTPALAVADYLAQLADERQRLNHLRDPEHPQRDVAATLLLSYAQLDPATQAVFRALGVLVADFTTELVQAVVVAPDGVDITLTMHALLRRNLVLYDAEHARWRLHDLVRDLARHQLEAAGEAEAAQWRYARAAVQFAQAIQDQYCVGGDTSLLALARFDTERTHIDAARRWAQRHVAAPDGDQLLLATALATRFIGLIRHDPRQERIPLWEGVRTAAQRLGNRAEEARALSYLGIAYAHLGETRTAISYFEQDLAINRELGDRYCEGIALGNLGGAYDLLNESHTAISYFEQDLAIRRELGDRQGEGFTLGNLGIAYTRMGESHTAISYSEQALVIAREFGDRESESRSLCNLGDTYTDLGDLQRAFPAYEEALHLGRAIGARQLEGHVLIGLAGAQAMQGKHTDATATFKHAATLLQEVGDQVGLAECNWQFGLALIQQGEHEQALSHLRAAVAYQQEIGHAKAAEHAALLARLEGGEELIAELRI